VSSHGHTVFHDPKNGITKQIGNGKIIFDNINTDFVYDFRSQDIKLGGQGAPLVPIGDLNLFKNYKYCLNLGGFSNISIKENDKIIAFDISPVNTVLNHYSKKLGFEYDKNGTLSKKGIVDIDLLKKLNKMKYYELQGPKSLGIEFVIQEVFPLIDSTLVNDCNILRTYIEHIATQLKKTINENNEDKILITGGGAYNKTLIKVLKNKLRCNLVIPEKEIIENKEALIFAYLGLLRANNKINCLKSVTGASKNHSSGQIFRKL
jgi:anhydro-N-acetylmuramic acid kinase